MSVPNCVAFTLTLETVQNKIKYDAKLIILLHIMNILHKQKISVTQYI